MQILRMTLSLGASFFLMSFFFWGIQTVISSGIEGVEIQQATRIEFTRLRRDTEVKTRVRPQKVEREKATQAPPDTDFSLNLSAAGGGAGDMPLAMSARAALSGLSFGFGGGGGGGGRGGGAASSDREVVPLVRIQPDYPSRAAQRGIEGHVVVQFTITPAGTIKDARVVESEPRGVFDAAAVNAILRWKYNPKIQEGVAVEQPGIRVRLAFKLEKS